MPNKLSLRLFLILLAIHIVGAVNTSLDIDPHYNSHVCYARTLQYLADGVLAPDNDVFFRDAAGNPMSDPENMTLTLAGCKRICGPKRGWYTDIGPRLSTWLIPSLLLISNIELSPLDKRRFFGILHLVGDPIDSFGSLIDKLASWDYCSHIARRRGYCHRCARVIATVYAGFEEYEGARLSKGSSHIGHSRQRNGPHCYLDRLAIQHGLTTHFQEWRRTALDFANGRSDEFLRTGLAIVVYVYQLIGGFVKQVGGDPSSPPGGRIATGVLLSWLIPAALLSNVIGNLTSRYTVHDILARFAAKTGGPLEERVRESMLPKRSSAFRKRSVDPSAEAFSWSGGIHTFRPWRHHRSGPQEGWPRTLLSEAFSILPVCFAITGAVLILWNVSPTGFNCRHTWTIAVFSAWILSAFITRLSYTPRFASGRHHWYFVLLKDTLVAVPSVTMMFLSACGMFNDCKCWSGYLYHRQRAHVMLNADPFYRHNDSTLYQYIVWPCLGLQGLLFVVLMIKWRQGLGILRWSAKARGEERERMLIGYECTCIVDEKPTSPAAIKIRATTPRVEYTNVLSQHISNHKRRAK